MKALKEGGIREIWKALGDNSAQIALLISTLALICFGKLYLKIYGNDVNKQDMKSIFENWNMESQSAFKDIRQEDFQPKSLEKLKEIVSLVRSENVKNPMV